ncbi:PAP2 superfamily C-terminal [Phytophthora infestans]|uniref:PAP2 superfamily C-terminal n=1 Tax=Phytophthora infestans TaxID=4787 RepID=A0A8S9V6R3_PHYIN|nr:PAP2 superfamily C-terminal [Phytophthora infestans]
MSLASVFSVNTDFYLHVPATMPLRDLGITQTPEHGLHSKWRPVGDILTAGVPVMLLLQTFFYETPQPSDYFPPITWIDTVHRVGSIYGNYYSCGDHIFLGHIANTNSAVLLYLRTLARNFAGRTASKIRRVCRMTCLMSFGALCIAGHKRHTVDVVLGLIISTLVFFHFEHSWTPLCFQVPNELLPVGELQRIYGSQFWKRFSMDVSDDALSEPDDTKVDEEVHRLLRTSPSTRNQVQLIC